MNLVSGNKNYRHSKAFLGELSSNLSRVVEIDEFAVFTLLFVRFRNRVEIIVPYDDTSFWISADTNKDDFE